MRAGGFPAAEHWLHKPGALGSIPGDCQPFHSHMYTLTPIVTRTTRFEITAQVCWSFDCDVHALVPSMSGILCIAVLLRNLRIA